mgnify:FL=1|tara:strand:+ start:468 stop:668 length:201 start_codon:yes stop_codon:yes gene_type:complete
MKLTKEELQHHTLPNDIAECVKALMAYVEWVIEYEENLYSDKCWDAELIEQKTSALKRIILNEVQA